MKSTRRFGMGLSLVLAASACYAGTGTRLRTVTDATGTYLVQENAEGDFGGFGFRDPPEIRWVYDRLGSIAQNVALSGATNSAWVGQDLNFEALQRFDLSGDGTPASEYDFAGADFTTVAAARNADRAVFLERTGGVLTLHAFHVGADEQDWSFSFDEEFTGADNNGVKVSRDGSRVCALVFNPTSGAVESRLYIFDGAGNFLRFWSFPNFAGPIDLTDDGSLCLVTQGSTGRVIDTETATELFSAPGSGAGSRHKISGDGSILVLGGFSLHVFERTSPTTWNQIINFTAPTSWFGAGAAVSRDGSTVGVMSHVYLNYLDLTVRTWDIASRSLLGTYNVSGTGSYQSSISGGVLSNDGSVFAVSSWGTQNNDFPEVLIFDRNVNLIGSVDTVGSPFSLDLTESGIYALIGSKAAHANVFGNGGSTTLYQISLLAGDVDGDCDVDLADLATQLSNFGATGVGRDQGDLDADGDVDLADLATLLSNFGAACGA